MKLLSVATPPSIYHGFSTWKMLWEGKFTPCEFTHVNMKNCVRRNVRKHIDIKDSEKYIPLNTQLNFGSLDKMKITSSEPKDKFGMIRKGVD